LSEGRKVVGLAVAGPLGSLAFGREKLIMRLGSACIARASRGVQTVLWRSCSQYKQVATNEDLVRKIVEFQVPLTFANGIKLSYYCYLNKGLILLILIFVYKNYQQLLSQFVSPFTGCIYGRHITGLCGKKQKEITKAIKRAQIMGFMPVTYKDPAYLKDPKICNIKY
ncbi:28S ribosomal protein S18c, mitochondrial, partial [Vombatus ursinus]|uniref:28S ribosomal protein S18c, mitochondrial n=1 Tax=Vombatus ursinus TaxID=29139 RepID=UPI000FFDBDEA